jgi:hypothetical protein
MVDYQGNHLGFVLRLSELKKGIFIAKYYNPEIAKRLHELKATHHLIHFENLLNEGYLSISTGNEIGKMAYGTGFIPFIRTSDIGNWEIKTDPKQGVSQDIYDEFSLKQDVRAGDIFFVKDGTYLIGQSCFITKNDLPCLYQSHIIKIRINPKSPISNLLLFICLNSPIVKKQIKSKQFTADIIDTIGNRINELTLPIPKNEKLIKKLIIEFKEILEKRIDLREKIKTIPLWTQQLIPEIESPLPQDLLRLENHIGNAGFTISLNDIRSRIFIPRYYDPKLEEDLHALLKTHYLVTLGNLVKDGIISWQTGIEIGKMAYGTGPIPFIRTSDISNWELKIDPKQKVSEEIYEENRQDVRTGDIFVVRDGTYLVGTSCILTENDTRILFCGGLYKLRLERKEKLNPYLFLALLNTPIVRRQMRAKQFTRDVIDTLGKRLFEIILPIPRDKKFVEKISLKTRELVEARLRLRNRKREIALEVEGIERPEEEDLEILNNL